MDGDELRSECGSGDRDVCWGNDEIVWGNI